jgi:hypothetical protein
VPAHAGPCTTLWTHYRRSGQERTDEVCGLLLDRLDGDEGSVDLVREYAAVVGFGAIRPLERHGAPLP